jgi:hypothetical protein
MKHGEIRGYRRSTAKSFLTDIHGTVSIEIVIEVVNQNFSGEGTMKRKSNIIMLVVALALLGGCIVSVAPDRAKTLHMNPGDTANFSVKSNIWEIGDSFVWYTWSVCIDNKVIYSKQKGSSYNFEAHEGGKYQIRCEVEEYYDAIEDMLPGPILIRKQTIVWNVEVSGIALQPFGSAININPGQSQEFKAKAWPEGSYQYDWRLNGDLVSSNDSFIFTPGGDQTGSHTLEITASGQGMSYTLSRKILVTWSFVEDRWANAVSPTNDGGYIIAGWKQELLSLYRDSVMIRIDDEGEIAWQRVYSSLWHDQAVSVQQTEDGGFILAGSWYPLNDSDYNYLIKTDTAGAKIWQIEFPSANTLWEVTPIVQQTPDGGYIIAGGKYTTKLDSQGNIEWGKACIQCYGMLSVRVSPDGGYVCLSDSHIFKLDSKGDLLWQTEFSPPLYAYRRTLPLLSSRDGGFLVVTEKGIDSVNLATDYRAIKFDSSGAIQWDLVYDVLLEDIPSAIVQTDDDGYLLAGDSTSFYEDPSNGAYILKLDVQGAVQFTHRLGILGTIVAIIPAGDSRYLLAVNYEEGCYLIGMDAAGNI